MKSLFTSLCAPLLALLLANCAATNAGKPELEQSVAPDGSQLPPEEAVEEVGPVRETLQKIGAAIGVRMSAAEIAVYFRWGQFFGSDEEFVESKDDIPPLADK